MGFAVNIRTISKIERTTLPNFYNINLLQRISIPLGLI